MGTSWLTGTCTGCASSPVLIAAGSEGEIEHQSENIPRAESLCFKGREPQSRNWCCFQGLLMLYFVFSPLLLSICLGTSEWHSKESSLWLFLLFQLADVLRVFLCSGAAAALLCSEDMVSSKRAGSWCCQAPLGAEPIPLLHWKKWPQQASSFSTSLVSSGCTWEMPSVLIVAMQVFRYPVSRGTEQLKLSLIFCGVMSTWCFWKTH